jgi:bifunctional non-homologous end joining protein LigD
MFSRQGWDMSHAFPELINELNELPKGTAIDGELLMFDEDGRPERNRLLGLPALSRPGSVVRAVRSKAATIVCWDLLMLNGRDLRTHPLLERKAALHKLIRSHRSIQYAGHVADAGERMFAEAQFLSLEGIVAKRAQSLYVAGQTRDWLKIRTAAGRSAQTLRKGEAEVHR